MSEYLKNLSKGANGFILGLFILLLMFLVMGYLGIRLVAVWAIPPLTPYSITLLGWPIISLGLWTIVAHTALGNVKIGRLTAGIFVGLSVFFGLETYVLSWIAKIFYWPITRMDLSRMSIDDTSGYGLSVMAIVGLLICVIYGVFLYQLLINPSFWDSYYSWKLEPFLRAQIADKREDSLDIQVCVDAETKKPVVIPEDDLTLNTMIEGPTGGGKTSQVMMTMIGQVLANPRAGGTFMEPKLSSSKQAYALAVESGNPYAKFINPNDPDTDVFNPLEGEDPDLVAAVNEAMLTAMFGRQEAFFKLNQSAIVKNLILLLKYIKHNDLDYFDLDEVLLDESLVINYVQSLKMRLPENEPLRSPRRRLIRWFDKEFFGPNKDKIREFSLGLRVQIQNMLSNKYFTRCIIGKSTIDMDKLLADGGFMAVSTHDGLLKNLSKALGMVVTGHLQAAVERRSLPVDKTDKTQQLRPHVIFIDELGTFANEEFSLFLTKVREYNVPVVVSFQQFSNLDIVDRNLRKTVIGMCRSRIWFPDIPPEDAEWYSKLSGEHEYEDVSSSTGTSRSITSILLPDSFRENEMSRKVQKVKFTYTDILEAPAGTVFYRVMQNRTATPTNRGIVDWFARKESSIGNAYWFDHEEFKKAVEKNKFGDMNKKMWLFEWINKLLAKYGLTNLGEKLGIHSGKASEVQYKDEGSAVLESPEEIMKKAVTRPPVEIKADRNGAWITKEEVFAQEGEPEREVEEKREEPFVEQPAQQPSEQGDVDKQEVELPPLKKNEWATSADDLL